MNLNQLIQYFTDNQPALWSMAQSAVQSDIQIGYLGVKVMLAITILSILLLAFSMWKKNQTHDDMWDYGWFMLFIAIPCGIIAWSWYVWVISATMNPNYYAMLWLIARVRQALLIQ